MDEPKGTGVKADLRDFLAAERTFLAWIRTGLALMAFGFVVARFGLFLQQLQLLRGAPSEPSYGLSLWFGTALIALGVIVNLSSAWHHLRLVRELDRGAAGSSRPSTLAMLIALLLSVVGIAMAIYLFSTRSSAHPTAQSKEISVMQKATAGIIDVLSNHSVEQTLLKLQDILRSKGIKLFSVIDHSGEAERVGLRMPPTKLLIFGNPKAGTPLMLAAPRSAIDLPLKILIWEDVQGKAWVSYNSPEYLQGRHGLATEMVQNIRVVETLATQAAE